MKKEKTDVTIVSNGEIKMDKLQYDIFYKFIVSAGIILIVAPLFCLHYLVSGSYDIILTQEEADNLSAISSSLLNTKMSYMQNIFKYLPIICIVFIIIGILFIILGCYKWHNVQKKLDQLTDLDLQEKQLNIKNMSAPEIAEKMLKEDIENNEDLPAQTNTALSYQTTSSRIKKAFEIEDAVYKHLKTKLHRKYTLHQNVKVGNCEYDLIASSKYDNIDLLYKIKYWNNLVSKATLARLVNRAEKKWH